MFEAIYAELKDTPAYVRRDGRGRQNKAHRVRRRLGSVAEARTRPF